MNTVNFETAKALQDAGFPQPEPAPGQFWYNTKSKRLCVVTFNKANWQFRVSYFGSATATGGYLNESFVFAPQAHDVLEQLGWEFYLLFDQTAPQWICNQPNNEVGIWTDKNPHEAAAKAYLQLRKPA